MGDAPTDTNAVSPDAAMPSATPLLHTASYDPDVRGMICPAIVEAVSAATGIPGTEMDRPLNDIVDVDALESLFESRLDGTPRLGGRIEFTYCGCEVVVDSTGGQMGVYARSA